MSTQVKWLVAIFTLIGAVVGLFITLRVAIPLFMQQSAIWQVQLIFCVATVLYGLGVLAGLRFVRDTARRGLLRVYYGLQVVALSAPVMEFRFASGAHVTPSLNLGDERIAIGLNFWVGSIWKFELFGEAAWSLGVNLVALAMLWLLRPRATPSPQAASDASATPTTPTAATESPFAPLK